jgi:predicted MFS family arabinose efflux permease
LNPETEKSPQKKSWNYGWVVIGSFMAIDSMVMAIGFSLGVFLPPMSEDLHMSLAQLGWMGSANWWVPAILSIPVASLLSRYPPKKLVAVSTFVAVPLVFLQGWAPNYALLLLFRIAFLAVTLARIPARPLLIQRWFPKEKISTVNSLLTVGMGAAGATVIFVTGDLIDALDGWRNVFYLFGGISALTLVAWMILGRENPPPAPGTVTEARGPMAIRAVWKYKALWLLGIGVTGDMLCFGAMEILWPKYAIGEGIASLEKTSYALGLSYYGFMVGCMLGGAISNRIGRRKPLIWIPGLLLPFLTLGILFSESYALIAALWFFWGILEVYFPVVMTIPYELPGIKPKEVVVATAFVMSVFTAGSALGPMMASYIAEAFGNNIKLGLTVACVFPILLFITGLLIPETGPKAQKSKG